MGGEANLTSTERWGCELKPGIWNWNGVQTEIPQKYNLEKDNQTWDTNMGGHISILLWGSL